MLFRQFPHQKDNKTHRNSKKQHEHEIKNRSSATIYLWRLVMGSENKAPQQDCQMQGTPPRLPTYASLTKIRSCPWQEERMTHSNTSIDDRFHINFYTRFSYIKKRTVSHGLFMAMPWQKPQLGHSAIREINATWLHSGRQQKRIYSQIHSN